MKLSEDDVAEIEVMANNLGRLARVMGSLASSSDDECEIMIGGEEIYLRRADLLAAMKKEAARLEAAMARKFK